MQLTLKKRLKRANRLFAQPLTAKPIRWYATQEKKGISNERISANDEAFKASVSSLNLQLAEGAINQEEYNKQLQTLVDGYNGKVDSIKAEVLGVELEIIGEAYQEELGADAAEKLNKVLQYSIENNIDPVEIPADKLFELLNVESLAGETEANIREMLSGVFSQVELIEVDGKLLVNLTCEKNVQNAIEVVQEDFGVPEEHAATVAMLLYGDKNILNQIDVSQLAKEFGIPESQAKTIIEKLTGEKSIENRLNVLASDFGIPDVIHKTVQVKVHGSVTATGNPKMDYAAKQAIMYNDAGYRGGIFGGDSAMDAFARGGRTDNSGIVGGSTRFIRVNEESPEMIIPLSSQRRERALKLWNKTGELLNVPGFFRGGRSDGGADDWSHLKAGGSGAASGGQDIHIDIGGITFEITVEGGDPETIAAAIKEKAEELAEMVAGILNDAFTGQFENTPVRGGVA